MSEPTGGVSRQAIYGLLITVAVAMACGRIMAVRELYDPLLYGPGQPRTWSATAPKPTPTLGGNDRSRWATIRALVDEGTYAIGTRDPANKTADNKYGDTGITFEPGWGTYDKVLHPDTQKFYSSKPPLLPTILAGEYWVLKKTLGWSIVENRFVVMRIILLTINALPFLIYLLLLSRLCDELGTSDWSRLFVMTTACFATLVTPFLITLNNHTVAACGVLFALYPVLRTRSAPSPFALLVSGLFAGFAFCVELPALAFLVALFAILLVRAPVRTLLFFAPAAAVPISAHLFTNYLAIGEFLPAYSKIDSPWYRFEGGYRNALKGIDAAGFKESRWAYAFHMLLGHHGLFSLSPILVLAIAGIFFTLLGRKQRDATPAESATTESANPRSPWHRLQEFCASPTHSMAALTLFLTVVVIGFYNLHNEHNYGGWTAGMRWFMWLTPLWLITMLPAVDRLNCCRGGRILGYLLLGLSVISVAYVTYNPWRHPWIYNLMDAHGWIPY